MILRIAVLALIIGCGGPAAAPEGTTTPEKGPAGGGPPTVLSEQEVDVAKLAAIAKAIDASPSQAKELLEEAGLTPATLRKQLFAVARSPELTAAFEAQRR